MKYIEILWTSKLGYPLSKQTHLRHAFRKNTRDTAMNCSCCWWQYLIVQGPKVPRFQGSLVSLSRCHAVNIHRHLGVRRAFTPTKQCSLVRWMIDESPYMTLCCLSHRGRRVVQIELLSRSLTLRVFRSFPQFSSINKRKHDRSTVLTVAFNDSGLPAIPRYQGGKLGKYKGKLW